MVKERKSGIDVIKVFAIIAVILLHSLPVYAKLKLFACFHIWQAVPLFMVIAGYNLTASFQRRGLLRFKNQLCNVLDRLLYRIVIPFLIIWMIQIALISIVKPQNLGLKRCFASILAGGYGPGSYFIPVYIQGACFIPVLFLINRHVGNKSFLILLFVLSIAADWILKIVNISEPTYRLLFTRYIFAITLGYAIYYRLFNKWLLVLPLSIYYIYYATYKGYLVFDYPSWRFQHTIGFFYTAFIVVILIDKMPLISNAVTSRAIRLVSDATYHIFLVQMLYFWTIGKKIAPFLNRFCFLLTNLLTCIILGILFHKLNHHCYKKLGW